MRNLVWGLGLIRYLLVGEGVWVWVDLMWVRVSSYWDGGGGIVQHSLTVILLYMILPLNQLIGNRNLK